MHSVSPEQWQAWKENMVTSKVFEAIRERIEETKEQLSSPDSSPERDRFLKGMIWSFNEVLDVKLELTSEGEPEDEVSSRDTSS